ncbi:SAM-dependent DNA methyltransferase [Hassallia byssoidea VB512170]|uniref:SAM-dependent DNA methyltransferase n=1 Tax=Hassallia byssoidea VB512170 TaxID=1304833 RepID=A0A846H567_9CYAN|nr:DNA methyltransferase [Hassalia byssoidea]NEU71731.1 SAM-dependent DNA methyltransferase [Hassalia byssoidea VB512170]
MQLSLFSLPQQDNFSFDIFNIPDTKKAEKLRELAAQMQSIIDQKKNPAIGNQRATHRRKTIAQGIIQEGIELETIQSWIKAIAQMWEVGNIPPVLRGFYQKSQVEALYRISQRKNTPQDIQAIFNEENYQSWLKSLSRAGLHTASEIVSAIEEIQQIVKPEEIDTTKQQLNKLELEIIGMKSGDFFSTPESVCQRLIELADIQPNWRILEPNAGSGSIASCITNYPNVQLEVVEINPTLRQLLELKGFNLVGKNFLEFNPNHLYNACIMNPPFCEIEEHIYHAWKLICRKGILISIVPESVFFNRKYKVFKEWLYSRNTYDEKLEKEAFLQSNNPTGVATRIIKIIKP